MAVSFSSGQSPTDFIICTSFEDMRDVISVAVERCQLCGPTKRPFYCKDCVTNGDFVYSKSGASMILTAALPPAPLPLENLSYSQKLERWKTLKKERSEILSRFEVAIQGRLAVGEKRISVASTKKRIILLQKAVDATRTEVKHSKVSLKTLAQENAARVNKSRLHEEKQCHICDYITQMETNITEQHHILSVCRSQLAAFRRDHIHDLLTYIFSVTEVQPKSETDSMVDALAEARHTAYIRGRWVYTDNGSEHNYQVVAPSLPGNGDYSIYSSWLMENRDASGLDTEFGRLNPAYTICAALSHTAQLTSLLAYFLQINLPEALSYREFLKSDLSESEFAWAVYRLNHNVLFLCFTQSVDPEQLNARCTVRNLLMLIKAELLGSNGPFIADEQLMQSVDDTLPPEAIPECDDQQDWEQVPACLPHISESFQSSSPINPGLISSAAASVASFWRVATGRHDSA